MLKGHIRDQWEKIIDSNANLMRNLFGRVAIHNHAGTLFLLRGTDDRRHYQSERPLTGISLYCQTKG